MKLIDPYIPTDKETVKRMIDFCEIKEGENFCDLGSGDARFLVEAKKRGANVYGIEIDSELARKSQGWLNRNGIVGTIIEGDILEADYSKYDVITAFFRDDQYPQILEAVGKTCKKGARIIVHGNIEGGEFEDDLTKFYGE